MGENLLTVFGSADIDADEIKSMKMGVNSKTGELFARATMSNGTSYVQRLSQGGVKISERIEIPAYHSIEERRKVVRDLYNSNYTQSEIADFCNISQSTVHNDLNK